MPTLSTFTDFERDFEVAAVDFLTAADVPAIAQRGGEDLATPRVGVRFDGAEPTGHLGEVNDVFINDQFRGRFTFSIKTNRQENNSSHGALVAAVRAMMLEWQTNFDGTNLPNQRLCWVKETSATQAAAGENIDETTMQFEVTYTYAAAAFA